MIKFRLFSTYGEETDRIHESISKHQGQLLYLNSTLKPRGFMKGCENQKSNKKQEVKKKE